MTLRQALAGWPCPPRRQRPPSQQGPGKAALREAALQGVALRLAFAALLVASAGCAGAGKRPSETPQEQAASGSNDPWQSFNRSMFSVNETLDRYLLKPTTQSYVRAVPEWVRDGIGNFLDNMGTLNTILNDFLQGKVDQGLSDTSRFIFNSTIGLGGLVDVATPLGLPAHREDLGQTLAVWGVPQGPYLFLPLFGPNTVRILPDRVVSRFTDPLTYAESETLLATAVLSALDGRAGFLENEESFRQAAAFDPYAFLRDFYLQRRAFLIYDGAPPESPAADSPLEDEWDQWEEEENE